MSFDFGLESPSACFKRKYRWLLKIPEVSATGVDTLPPSKAGRPSISFKSMEAQHMIETINFPSKPEWKAINLTLFDLKKSKNPVIEWISKIYEVTQSSATYKVATNGFKKEATLELYDGCGEVIEKWVMENVYIESADFGDLDYTSSDVCMIDLSLKYDRAYKKI